MVELFFIKRFILQKFIPYAILSLSIGYLIYECICPKHIKEYFYSFSDRLFFKYIIKPFQNIKNYFKKLKLSIKSVINAQMIKYKKNKQKKLLKKENLKKKKEFEANEKSKKKLNKKIDKVNKKIGKENKKIKKKNKRRKMISVFIIKALKLKK